MAKPGSAWPEMVQDLSDVQKLVHLAYRLDGVDKEELRSRLLRQLRDAYESEITIQAAKVGCPGVRGSVTGGPVLNQLNEIATLHAQSITNTYNRDLVYSLQGVKADTARANRNTYAYRLGAWDQQRAVRKVPQIAMMTENTARSLAQQHFRQFNDITGYAELEPKTAVCPVCQGWINRGKVPLPVALNNPPPYHINCCPAGVLVQMANGDQKPIQEVAAEDEVLTRGGSCRVIQALHRYAAEPVYRVYVCGRVLRVTGDHPLLTETGWRPAQELQAGDKILLAKDHEAFEFEPIERIEIETEFSGEVFTLQTENEEFIAEGIVVHNCPHAWSITPDRVPPDECRLLWVGS